jgi:hypothetical protein
MLHIASKGTSASIRDISLLLNSEHCYYIIHRLESSGLLDTNDNCFLCGPY